MTTSPRSAELVTTEEAARYLGLKKQQLAVWRQEGTSGGPPFFRLGRLVRYTLDDLDAWLETRRVTCAS